MGQKKKKTFYFEPKNVFSDKMSQRLVIPRVPIGN